MIQMTFCQPSSIILADLERHVIMEGFLAAALTAAGLELRWEYAGEYITSEEGFIAYHQLGRRLAAVVFVGPVNTGPSEPSLQQEGL